MVVDQACSHYHRALGVLVRALMAQVRALAALARALAALARALAALARALAALARALAALVRALVVEGGVYNRRRSHSSFYHHLLSLNLISTLNTKS